VNERQVSMGSSWVNIVLGIFVVILAVCARYSFYQGAVEQYRHGSCGRCSCHHPLEKASTGWSWPNLILGIWLVISPFVLFASGPAMWNNAIAGIIISALALSNTYSRARPYVA